jgi:solute carrier family 15 oligopeptide transporter 1
MNNPHYYFQFVDSSNKTDSLNEAEGVTKKTKYPFSVFFIVSNEFCERFNYYGMRSKITILLRSHQVLNIFF